MRTRAVARATLAAERRVLGENHPNTLKTLANLANLYDDQGRYDTSAAMMQDVLARRRKALGPDHPDTSPSAVPSVSMCSGPSTRRRP